MPAEHERGRDEREVRQRLREVSELSFRHGVVLLREKPDVVAKGEETLEDLARLIVMTLLVQHRGEPERAREEHAFTRRKTVDAFLVRAVPEEQSVHGQFAPDRLER